MIHRNRLLVAATMAACLFVGSQALGQFQSQTLPVGFATTDGSNDTAFPFNTTDDQIWQWHYPASDFLAGSEILITDLSVRAPDGLSAIAAFSVSDLEITLIEASTAVGVHDPVFANNVRRQAVVRRGLFAGTGVPASGRPTADWLSLRLQGRFLYDPSTGNDLIIQVRKCGPTVPFLTNVDGEFGTAVRAGHRTDCNAASLDFGPQSFTPIVKIDYAVVQTQTLPSGFANAEGNSSTSFPFDSNSDHTWQWHYDSSEFNNPFPVSIVDISVRANNNASISAFEFGSVSIDLIEASTDYLTVSHDTTFANNVLRSKRTRAASPWSGPGLASSLSGPADFLPLESTRSFFYDPNTNNDFIVELRSCGVVSNWGASVDGQSGGVGVVGGNRYGHTSDCTATAQNTTNNEFVPITKISYVPANVSSFPYVQTFDHLDLQNADEQPLGWEQSDTDGSQDWFFINVPTSSTNTGPPADHTTGVPGQGGYAYTEDSNGSEPAVDLLTPVFDFSGVANPRMSFWMHSRDGSNGSTPNHLRVSAILYPSGTIVGPLTPAITPFGDDEWHQVTVNLGSLAGQRAQVVFRGTTDGGSFTNDIAIDDLVVVDFQGGPGQNPQAGLATLDVNAAIEANGLSVSSGAPGPYVAQARLAETMIFDFGGAPNQPILLLAGPLNPGITTFPGIGQLDIGANPVVGGVPSSLFVVADGNLVTPPDLFFRTDLFGGARFVYPTPNLPPGSFLNLQAILFTGGPSVIAMSNAVRIIITP